MHGVVSDLSLTKLEKIRLGFSLSREFNNVISYQSKVVRKVVQVRTCLSLLLLGPEIVFALVLSMTLKAHA